MAYQGMARCNKCRSGFSRDAPRERRSISMALQSYGQAILVQRNTNLAMKIAHSTHRLAEISLYLPVPAFNAT